MMENKRDTWSNDREFFLVCLGCCVGIANIWRFPYLCYENGGGAFLIPYLFAAAFIGIPMYFLEIAHGQFMQKGPIGAYNLVPALKGVGLCSVVINIYCNWYYITVIAWGIFYFAHSFTTGDLPWTTCNNTWNTASCTLYKDIINNSSTIAANATLSVEEFWDKHVLRRSSGFHQIGATDNWPLLISFIVAWILCYLCVFKGVRSTGKVVYVTAISPYIILTILVIRGCMLPGAAAGLKYYMIPDFKKILNLKVWVQAASQCVFSYTIGFAILITLGSYNKFNTNCYKYSVLLTLSNSFTSLFAGLSVFSVLGHLAHLKGSNVSTVVASGSGLVFQTYPLAVSLLPAPQLWSVLFFAVIILIGIDSQFTTIEGMVAAINDTFPNLCGMKHKREILPLILCTCLAILGIPMTFGVGIYIFELANNHAASGVCLFMFLTFESVTIAYFYGIDKFFDDIKAMIGYHPNVYLKWCYRFFTPVICLFMVVYTIAYYKPLVVYGYEYPTEMTVVGWLMTISSIIMIPIFAAYKIFTSGGRTIREQWRNAIKPKYGPHLKNIGYRNEEKPEIKLLMTSPT